MGFLETLVATLLGVCIAGWISHCTTRTQLKHDAEQRERERKMSLRRDVYLEVSEAIGRTQSMLASFSRNDLNISQLIDKAHENPGSLNKVHIVGSEETLKALVEYAEFLARKVADLLPLRIRWHDLQEELRWGRETIAQIEAEQQAIVTAVQGRSEADPRVGQMLSRFESNFDRLESLRAEVKDLAEGEVAAIKVLSLETLKAAAESHFQAGKLNICIRREVELPIDQEVYLGLLQGMAKRVEPELNRAFDQIDQIYQSPDGDNG